MALQPLTGTSVRQAFAFDQRELENSKKCSRIAMVVGLILAGCSIIAGVVILTKFVHTTRVSQQIGSFDGWIDTRRIVHYDVINSQELLLAGQLLLKAMPLAGPLAGIFFVAFHFAFKTYKIDVLKRKVFAAFAEDHEFLNEEQRIKFLELADREELLQLIFSELKTAREQNFAIEKFGKATILKILTERGEGIEAFPWQGNWQDLYGRLQTIQNEDLESPFIRLQLTDKIETLNLQKRILVANLFFLRTLDPNDAMPLEETIDLAGHSHFLQLEVDAPLPPERSKKVVFLFSQLFGNYNFFAGHRGTLEKMTEMLIKNKPVDLTADEEKLFPHVLAHYFDDFFEKTARYFLTPQELQQAEFTN